MKMFTNVIAICLLSATAFAQSQLRAGEKIMVLGKFVGMEGCYTNILGNVENTNTKVDLCGKISGATKFTNGATKAALEDQGSYYIIGTVTDDKEKGDNAALIVTEIAGLETVASGAASATCQVTVNKTNEDAYLENFKTTIQFEESRFDKTNLSGKTDDSKFAKISMSTSKSTGGLFVAVTPRETFKASPIRIQSGDAQEIHLEEYATAAQLKAENEDSSKFRIIMNVNCSLNK